MEKRPLRSPVKNPTRVLCTRLAGLAIRSDTWSAALHLRHALPPQFRNASLRLLRRQFPQAGLRRGGQCDRAQCCQRVHRRDRKAHTERDRQTPSQNAPCKPVHDPTTIYPRYYSSPRSGARSLAPSHFQHCCEEHLRLSRSCTRNRGWQSQGQHSTICRAVHSAVGYGVTCTCRTCRLA